MMSLFNVIAIATVAQTAQSLRLKVPGHVSHRQALHPEEQVVGVNHHTCTCDHAACATCWQRKFQELRLFVSNLTAQHLAPIYNTIDEWGKPDTDEDVEGQEPLEIHGGVEGQQEGEQGEQEEFAEPEVGEADHWEPEGDFVEAYGEPDASEREEGEEAVPGETSDAEMPAPRELTYGNRIFTRLEDELEALIHLSPATAYAEREEYELRHPQPTSTDETTEDF